MKTQNLSPIKKASLGAITLALLSACGSSGITGAGTITAPNTDNVQYISDEGGTYAAYPFSFSVYGQNPWTTTTALRTDNKLVVTAKAGFAERNNSVVAPPTNFAAEYNCAVYEVTLQIEQNGVYVDQGSVVTQPLTVPGTSGCENSVASQNIDFSAYLYPGHGLVKVKVRAIKTDFYCILYKKCVSNAQTYWSNGCSFARQTNAYQYACPLKTIWDSHTVTGSLSVHVNGSI